MLSRNERIKYNVVFNETPENAAAFIDADNIVIRKAYWTSRNERHFVKVEFEDNTFVELYPDPKYKGPFGHDIFMNLKNKDLWPEMKKEQEQYEEDWRIIQAYIQKLKESKSENKSAS